MVISRILATLFHLCGHLVNHVDRRLDSYVVHIWIGLLIASLPQQFAQQLLLPWKLALRKETSRSDPALFLQLLFPINWLSLAIGTYFSLLSTHLPILPPFDVREATKHNSKNLYCLGSPLNSNQQVEKEFQVQFSTQMS